MIVVYMLCFFYYSFFLCYFGLCLCCLLLMYWIVIVLFFVGDELGIIGILRILVLSYQLVFFILKVGRCYDFSWVFCCLYLFQFFGMIFCNFFIGFKEFVLCFVFFLVFVFMVLGLKFFYRDGYFMDVIVSNFLLN